MSTTHREPARASAPSSRGRWALIVLLLLPAIVVPLLVPFYDRVDPELAGFPFFFWFQLALIPVAVVLTAVAYRLSTADRRDREARREPRP